MRSIKNERGSVIVFVTLIIVLLLIMVGMGLDTGHLAYVRAQGQPAVDAAALAAAAAIPTNDPGTVRGQATKFNYGAANTGGNNYVNSPGNLIDKDKNVTLVHYDPVTQTITQATGVTGTFVGNANGARVALENSNPYDGPVGAAMKAPLFLTPLLNLFGLNTPGTANVSVSAVAVIQAVPGLPISVVDTLCEKTTTQTLNFQGGPGGNAGYTSYNISNPSANTILPFFDALPNCEGQPVVDTGYCTNLNNGVIENIFNKTLPPIFSSNPGKCYLMPVVAATALTSGGSFVGCSVIKDWAQFCPDPTDPFNKDGTEKGQLKGTITCGHTPFTSTDSKCYVPRLVRDTRSGM